MADLDGEMRRLSKEASEINAKIDEIFTSVIPQLTEKIEHFESLKVKYKQSQEHVNKLRTQLIALMNACNTDSLHKRLQLLESKY